VSSRLGLAAALVCATALIAGCAPSAEPTPTKTAAFASEDEAFAAAEKTYRAYVDALNNVDLSDPATFEDVYKWETGDALADEKKSLTGMHADGLLVSGETHVVAYTAVRYRPDVVAPVMGHACVDISNVSVTNTAGESQVSPDRPDRYAVEIGFVVAPFAAHRLKIESISNVDDSSCASS